MNFLIYSNNIERSQFLKENINQIFKNPKILILYGQLDKIEKYEYKSLYLINPYIGRQILTLENIHFLKNDITFVLDDDIYFFNDNILKEFKKFKYIYYVHDPFNRPYVSFKINANGGFLIFKNLYFLKKWSNYVINEFIKFLKTKDYTNPLFKDFDSRLEQYLTSKFIEKYKIFSKSLNYSVLLVLQKVPMSFCKRFSAIHYIYDKNYYYNELRSMLWKNI